MIDLYVFSSEYSICLAMIYGDTQDYNEWQYRHIEYSPYGELCIEEVAARLDKLSFRFTCK
ncbi:YD repeat-containing protein [Treponema pedis str. T A4]|uniref:YD repeat-containing protein n=1 Tax=Treponema pedis str. T A4 TaxID=1291379 RepID=S5ZVA6_9SPIR|nr:hypothetical protein [Treponema pedis]AGT44200.1 YD repeat-containing protein [Treponema pedis str. T A4]